MAPIYDEDILVVILRTRWGNVNDKRDDRKERQSLKASLPICGFKWDITDGIEWVITSLPVLVVYFAWADLAFFMPLVIIVVGAPAIPGEFSG